MHCTVDYVVDSETYTINLDPSEEATQIWMNKRTGVIGIIHNMYISQEGVLTLVGYCLEDESSETFPFLPLDVSERLEEVCERIGNL